MKKPRLTICGVMSGSSLDGLDMAICNIERAPFGQFDWSIERADTFSFPDALSDLLMSTYEGSASNIYSVEQEFSKFSANCIKTFIDDSSVDYVGMHGHTIFHHPEDGYTVQIGNGQFIAHRIGIPVICEMRSKDIALGGQGAPLAPTVEKYLLSEFTAFLNLGGIANISLHQDDKITAFDITACNQPLNYLCQKHFDLPYDNEGKLAAKGKLDTDLLEKLNALPYLTMEPPKSLANTWVINDFMSIVNDHIAPHKNKLNTIVQHMAIQTAKSLENMSPETAVYATGGGVFNKFMMKCLSSQLSKQGIVLEAADSMMAEFKEALLMALMAYLSVHELPNSFASVTGAKKDNCNGVVYHP